MSAGDVGQVVEMYEIVAAQCRKFSVAVTQQGLAPMTIEQENDLIISSHFHSPLKEMRKFEISLCKDFNRNRREMNTPPPKKKIISRNKQKKVNQ